MEKYDFDARLKRKEFEAKQTIGEITVYQDRVKPVFDCLTMELEVDKNERRDDAIPAGLYLVEKRYTEKRGWHWHVKEVPNRDLILIHDRVNYIGSENPKTGHSDILGCIIPCYEIKDLNGDGIRDIAPRSSTKALKDFNAIMDELGLDKFTLLIE